MTVPRKLRTWEICNETSEIAVTNKSTTCRRCSNIKLSRRRWGDSPGKKTSATCKQCNQGFTFYTSESKGRTRGIYCSRDCRDEAARKYESETVVYRMCRINEASNQNS